MSTRPKAVFLALLNPTEEYYVLHIIYRYKELRSDDADEFWPERWRGDL
jgi:hypothetical protein